MVAVPLQHSRTNIGMKFLTCFGVKNALPKCVESFWIRCVCGGAILPPEEGCTFLLHAVILQNYFVSYVIRCPIGWQFPIVAFCHFLLNQNFYGSSEMIRRLTI